MELLELCQSTEEIIAILNEDSEDHGGGGPDPPPPAETPDVPLNADNYCLARVKLALKYEQKRVSVLYI